MLLCAPRMDGGMSLEEKTSLRLIMMRAKIWKD